MKSPLAISLAVVIAALLTALLLIKHNGDAQIETATGIITDYSNRLDTAQAQINVRNDVVLNQSNQLQACQAQILEFSNQLTEAQSARQTDASQLEALKVRLGQCDTDKQSLQTSFNRQLDSLTNQLAAMNIRVGVATTNLAQANEQFQLLENRFRRDVAERTVLERRFNLIPELETQIQKLQLHPGPWTTPENIYAGLGVEVLSNGEFHVIATNSD
jgi:chromosome segregation ATPase